MRLRHPAIRPSQWQRKLYQTTRSVNTTQPPPPRPYTPAPPRATPRPEFPDLPPVRLTIYERIFGKRKEKPVPEPEPLDPARGREAAERVVREGVLDPRYKDAAKKYTRLIVASPLAIYLTYELYRRRFEGVEQKTVIDGRVERPATAEDGDAIAKAEDGLDRG